ncbi:MAG: twitch domain-containing radical SAM protein, partial [Pseudomonadota bacterium]
SSTFCTHFFSQISSSTTGFLRPCCIFHGPVKNNEGQNFHASTHSIQEYFESETLNKYRNMSLNGQEIPNCKKCYEKEKLGLRSRRQRDNLKFKDSIKRLSERNMEPKIESIDLRYGNLCNLGCVTCEPKLSSPLNLLWAKHGEEKFSKESQVVSAREGGLDYLTWYQDESFRSELDKISQDVIAVNMVGGEPMINDEYFKVLEKMDVNNHESRVRLISNFMKFPDEKIKILEKFNNEVFCSIDGIGDDFEYIRYPGRFEHVQKNLEKVLRSKISPIIISTVSVLNVMIIPHIFRWGMELFKKYDKDFLIQMDHIVTRPSHLAIANLPPETKSEILELYRSFTNEKCFLESNPHCQKSFEFLIRYIESSVGDPTHIWEGWKYIEKFDEVRGNCWRDHAPWMEKVLNSTDPILRDSN